MARRDDPSDPSDSYRPVSGRRRMLIAVLAVATAVVIVLTMLDPALRLKRAQIDRLPVPPLCTEGRLNDCVGGKAEVINLQPAPASPPASAVR